MDHLVHYEIVGDFIENILSGDKEEYMQDDQELSFSRSCNIWADETCTDLPKFYCPYGKVMTGLEFISANEAEDFMKKMKIFEEPKYAKFMDISDLQLSNFKQ
jgi:hypothetical protein